MFPKLLLIILTVGTIACVLLVNRQQRIDTAHEISRTHWRIIKQEQALWVMRAEIARRCRPEQVKIAAEQLDAVWLPIGLPRPQSPTQPKRLAAGDRVSRAEDDQPG